MVQASAGLGNEAVNVDSGTATTDQANTLADATSAVVTATLSDGDMATLAGLSETGNAYSITITDTSVDAAALNTLDGKTTVAINASNITTLTGAAADLNTAYTANDNGSISGLSNEDVTLSDTTATSQASTPSMATPQAPSMPATSPPSPVLPLISIPPTPPTTTAPSQA